MKKIILTSVCLLMVSMAFTQPGPPAKYLQLAGPHFQFENTTHDFGIIKQGDQIDYEFKFTNSGNQPIIITAATGSCQCTVPDYPKEPVKPGESGIIKVHFNSAGKSGVQDKTVTINSNAAENSITLRLKGTVDVPPAVQRY